MASTLHGHSEHAQTALYNSRAYIYYSRYPVVKPKSTGLEMRLALRTLWNYTRLIIVTVMVMTLGAAFPILTANEFFFKPLFSSGVVGGRPYFALDLITASFMVVLGLIVPLLTLFFLVKIMRNPNVRRDVFN
ncbi:MAG: hypothetical protein LCI00_29015 [Chloroflexi bacterium]|nr:hypothetical protein [Chloroflexota bacterium]MCC6896771.1 hypothetical protein [Anaerolineae bacterium]